MKLIIPRQLPGANTYIDACRRNKHLANRLKHEAESAVIWAAKSQLRGVRFDGPVVMHYTWVEPNRRRDKDNIAFARKFVQDALVGAGVLENDGWAQIKGFSDDFAVDRKRPRVEVEIEKVEA